MKQLSLALLFVTLLPVNALRGFSNDDWILLGARLNHWEYDIQKTIDARTRKVTKITTKHYTLADFANNQNIFLRKQGERIANAYVSKYEKNKGLSVVYRADRANITNGDIVYLKPARQEYQTNKAPETRGLTNLYNSNPNALNPGNVVLLQKGSNCGFNALWNARAMLQQDFSLMQNKKEFEKYLEHARFLLENMEGAFSENPMTNICDHRITHLINNLLDSNEQDRVIPLSKADKLSLSVFFGLEVLLKAVNAAQQLTNQLTPNVEPFAFIINPTETTGWHWITIAFYRENGQIYYQIADSLGNPGNYQWVANRILEKINQYSGPGTAPTGFRQNVYSLTVEDKKWLTQPVADVEWNDVNRAYPMAANLKHLDHPTIQKDTESFLNAGRKVFFGKDTHRRGIITKAIFYPEQHTDWTQGKVTITFENDNKNIETRTDDINNILSILRILIGAN